MASRPYFILAVLNGEPGEQRRWAIDYGSYDRRDVVFELEDYREHGWKRRDLRILKIPTDTQAAVDAAIAELNGDKP